LSGNRPLTLGLDLRAMALALAVLRPMLASWLIVCALGLTGIFAFAGAPDLLELLRRRGSRFADLGRGRLGRGGCGSGFGSALPGCELPPLASKAERFQDRGELFAGAADHRHQ